MEENNIENREKPQKNHELLNALKWVFMWIAIAMAVMGAVWKIEGMDKAIEFLGGYVIEFSLSMDNLFVFMSIFTAFHIAEHAEHRILHWGIIGAIIMRLIFILAGVAIVDHFAWILYIFGVILIVNGLKMFRNEEETSEVKDSRIFRAVRKIMPMTEDFRGEKFFVKEYSESKGKMHHLATPLFGVLLLIEFSDIIFAIDSVPAVFSISTDPVIVYLSNILAILGLRQLYFVIEFMARKFAYVKYGVAVILMFTGLKLLGVLFDLEVSIGMSIGIIVGILVISMILSILISKKNEK